MPLPERINRLDVLAHNLWWSWHVEGRRVFTSLDYATWRSTGHNPVKQLLEISQDKIDAAAVDPVFLDAYDAAMTVLDQDIGRSGVCLSESYPELQSELIAYFSAEFALQKSLPIYAGGLGVLSGDTCKEAADMGLPMIAIGFMYPQGYFHQHVNAEGWQEEQYQQLNFEESPISPCLWSDRCGPLLKMQLGDRSIFVGAWLVHLGGLNLYLMDTNIEENSPEDRLLSNRLYTADKEQRIQQEIILGIGGVRLLRVLGMKPTIWHANEGHTSFMLLERIREEVELGRSFDEAARIIQASSIFTTHTPVPAGHDIFPQPLMEKYFRNYWVSLGLDRERFMRFGQYSDLPDEGFNMAVLALKLANHRNAVSELHGQVARRMWHVLWPDVKEENVPISYITNGVHIPTWIAPELYQVCEKYMGKGLLDKCDQPELWKGLPRIPDDEMWKVRSGLKLKLNRVILERAQERWASGEANAEQVLAMGALLEPSTLTIGFVRRFAEYKRPALIFRDIERLKKIIRNQDGPVQFVFAGKSHPADYPAKYLLHQVYNLAKDRSFLGRIVFIEDFDIHMARYLVQGIDVWLNTPRRLQEASGTSGMKAASNGALNMSVLDGWWNEAYNGKNGWAIGSFAEIPDAEKEDAEDAESIYSLLENEVVPLYYNRDRNGVPHEWLKMVKESIRTVLPVFNTRRMMKQYVEEMYLPALRSSRHVK